MVDRISEFTEKKKRLILAILKFCLKNYIEFGLEQRFIIIFYS
jgi:hypothetical protein